MSLICCKLHQLFNSLDKLDHSCIETADIPQNGIYILFEKGEYAHDKNRIVRVGTHTGDNQLRSRLKQHFLNENKDRSIFRKNIGRAILNKRNDPYIKTWNLDMTSQEDRSKYSEIIDHAQQKSIEQEITNYIQSNINFVVFPVEDKEQRLE